MNRQINVYNLRIADYSDDRVYIQDHQMLITDNVVNNKVITNRLIALIPLVNDYNNDISDDFEQSVQNCVDFIGEQYLSKREKSILQRFKEKCNVDNQQLFVVNWSANEDDCQCFVVTGDVNNFKTVINKIKQLQSQFNIV